MNKDFKLEHGNCLEVLKKYPDNHFDSIVTDPPYGIGFMGKEWDHGVPSKEIWAECLRVLKAGGHMIAFAGTRTQHRMACNIEDAGFEIRDMGGWLYGSGFPKSLNIEKSLKKKGIETDLKGITGTALKPALEPFTIARKPLSEKTIAENVLVNGVGGINIDDCRIPTDEKLGRIATEQKEKTSYSMHKESKEFNNSDLKGCRFPANLIHDNSDPIVDILGEKTKYFYSPKTSKKDRNEGLDDFEDKQTIGGGGTNGDVAKAYGSVKAVAKNNHPTVKPTDLMAYLCRLVTPENGLILDPFLGSGSTLKAAAREGFKGVGIDLDAEYLEIAKARIEFELNKKDDK